MFFLLFWRGSGGNPQITSAKDRGASWRRLVRATRKIHYFLELPGGASAGCRGPPLSGGNPQITSAQDRGVSWRAQSGRTVNYNTFGLPGGEPAGWAGRAYPVAPYKGGHRIGRPYRVAPLIGCAHSIRGATL